jgi:hypothetical protein
VLLHVCGYVMCSRPHSFSQLLSQCRCKFSCLCATVDLISTVAKVAHSVHANHRMSMPKICMYDARLFTEQLRKDFWWISS